MPLNYVYAGGRGYFHPAKSGHTLDAVKWNPKATFCVTGREEIITEEYTAYFRGVIVFGQVHILEEDTEKLAAIKRLAQKYAPEGSPENRRRPENGNGCSSACWNLPLGI